MNSRDFNFLHNTAKFRLRNIGHAQCPYIPLVKPKLVGAIDTNCHVRSHLLTCYHTCFDKQLL